MGRELAPREQGKRDVYMDVYTHYTRLIDEGDLQPGDQLPAYPEFKEIWGISHATATKIIRMLRDNDYVRTTTRGTFVYLAKADRLFKRLCDTLAALEGDGQQLQLEVGERGACIIGRDGAVCWNADTGEWDHVAS